jgi:S1-C subfamily serine protease
MNFTRIITAIALTTAATVSANANAQTAQLAVQQDHTIQAAVVGGGQVVNPPYETRVAPEALVIPQPTTPKLSFTGQIIPGVGMKVLSVRFGSPAAKAGLEHGDIVMSANGFPITQQFDLSNAVASAAAHNNGVVSMRVKNIRGCLHRGDLYVTVTAYLFGQPIPVAGVTPGIVIDN